MGNRNSSNEQSLTTEELLKRTNFKDDDLLFLNEKYGELSGSITKDGLIDMAEFQASLGFKEATTAARLFNCLDHVAFSVNGDKMIDFSEFVIGIAICAGNLGIEEMIKSPSNTCGLHFYLEPVSFKLYDLDGNGHIDKQELFVMLRSAMMENTTLELNERQLNDLVETTLTMVSHDHDKITFNDYRELVVEQPALLSLFSLNLDELKLRSRKPQV